MTFIKLNKTRSYVCNRVFFKYFHKLSHMYFGDNVPLLFSTLDYNKKKYKTYIRLKQST